MTRESTDTAETANKQRLGVEFTVWVRDPQDCETVRALCATDAAWLYCVDQLDFGDSVVLNVQAFGEPVRQFYATRCAGDARIEPHDAAGWV